MCRCQTKSTAKSVHQADGSSKLQVVGKKHISFTLNNREFKFQDPVVEKGILRTTTATWTTTAGSKVNAIAQGQPTKVVVV